MPRALRRRKPSTKRRAQWHYSRREATRFAESLDDYEHASVTDIGGGGPDGFWLVVHDHRFEFDYEMASIATTGTSSARSLITGSGVALKEVA
jgi:hypothetical protein